MRALLSNCPVNTSSVLIRQSAIERIGPFDESLRCWEDYDFWLQLACTEQFQFLPGPAVIYQISGSGRFLSSVVSGESAANLRKVVDAALERLRAREHVSQRFEDDVEAGIVTRIAGQFEMLQELDAKRTYLLTRPAAIPPPGSDVPAALDVDARPALREPLAGGECNGVIERFMRTLKEQVHLSN